MSFGANLLSISYQVVFLLLLSKKNNVNENGYTPKPNSTPTACVVLGCCIQKPGMRTSEDKSLEPLIPGYHISPRMG